MMGRQRLKNLLLASDSNEMLAAAPLEEAYTWTLSCRAALDSLLLGSSQTAPFHADRIHPGRNFRDRAVTLSSFTVDDLMNFSSLHDRVLYYADEPTRTENKAKHPHPLGAMFFKTAGEVSEVFVHAFVFLP